MAKETRFTVESVKAEGATIANIMTDVKTGVQYLLAVYPNVGSGVTIMVDEDGKPLLNK
ncbi:DUF6440 family protein [Listeria booriae]|uniref:DUF6440 domain-containing protein n=1 Tax=Listeria booriae TaxID=1552123 RepID=A0A7X1DA16_9LIST|nr:DUF6440 family protein [Listeria booriae]MBC1491004.1 hypothetical protein [Listeria booriae]MBC1491081.1 hypothetical protein [Listeria booriae]MBC2178221.1 hypothetical protein [Listeria booriae]MBC2178252.1 hypothetical protein [Listeria booriae]MBC2258836.1 hypothetical protein [Listeria booriae]